MILILKSFLPTEDISKTYLAMDAVCKTLNTTLEKSNGFDFSIAYGDFYTDIRKLHQSFKEASDIITLSESAQTNHLQSIYGLFLEYTANRMSPLVINQIIKPLIQKLSLENGEFGKTLLYTMEIYVDSCMNLSYCANALGIHRNTVNARVLKFQEITSLSPSTHFKDAFIVKMTALYLKQNEYASRTQDEIGR